jgi:hypothetical protein
MRNTNCFTVPYPKVLACLAVVILAACGGEQPTEVEPEPTELVAGFAGMWGGKALIEAEGVPPMAIPYLLWNDIPAGMDLPIYTPCPAGDGEIVAQGAGVRARWDGRLECAPVAVEGCEAVHVVLYRLDLAYDLNRDELTVTGLGSLRGCGVGPTPMSLYLAGTIG